MKPTMKPTCEISRQARALVSVTVWGLILVAGSSACTAIKPYEKEYLLEPVMGDDWSARLGAPLIMGPAGAKEKLGGGGAGGVATAGGTSCPTCGS